MPIRSEWILHNGKKIFFFDMSNLNEAEYSNAIIEYKNEILNIASSNPNQPVLTVVDTTKSIVTHKVKDVWKDMVDSTKHIKMIRANVGLTGLGRMVAMMLAKDIYFAKDMEDAKEWLVKNSIQV